MPDTKNLLREGAEAGVLGALAVAVTLLVVDILHGVPFLLPSILGQLVIFGREQPVLEAIPEAIAAYTAVHFLAFILFGIMVAYLVDLATREPVFRYLLLLVFIIFEVFFIGITYLILNGAPTLIPWLYILLANTMAAAVMSIYFWYHHPTITKPTGEPLGAETT